MFGISHKGQQPVVDFDNVPEIECAIRSRPPGRHHIEQIERDPLRSRHTSRPWDAGMKETMNRSRWSPIHGKRESLAFLEIGAGSSSHPWPTVLWRATIPKRADGEVSTEPVQWKEQLPRFRRDIGRFLGPFAATSLRPHIEPAMVRPSRPTQSGGLVR
jgi:hypothetical protein